MAFDLGDPIPLTFTTRDATGALAAVTTAVLTITLPDGSSVLPAVAVVSVGTYAPTTPYYSTMAGLHRVSWVGSGVNAQDYVDVFNVMAVDPHLLISLAETRAGLGITTTNAAKDEEIRSVIAAATPIMEDLVGPILRTNRTETYDGGTTQINLLWSPIISITSIIESYGSTYQRTLTQQDIFTGTSSDAFGYTVDLTTGIVTRRATGVAVPFANGKRNIQIAYISGRASISGNILLATRRLIRHLWAQEQQSFRPNVLAVPDPNLTQTPSGFAVPRSVVELCAADTRPPGLA